MKNFYVIITCISLIYCSCKNESNKPTSSDSIPNSKAIELTQENQGLKNEIKTTKQHENKTVELLGSFSIAGVTLEGDENQMLKMGFEGIDVYVPINQEQNSVLLPNKEAFKDTEVEIVDNNGKKHNMRTFPVFKATCMVSYGADKEANESMSPEVKAINDRIKNAGGNSSGSELNYKVVVTNIEWIGNRDYTQ